MNIPKGRTEDLLFSSSKIKPGSVHQARVYIPQQYDPAAPAALYVQQDGMHGFIPELFDKLIAEGTMPVCIGVGVDSGRFEPVREGGCRRSTRSSEYDGLGADYADFIIEELLPHIKKKLNLNISASADLHLIAGCSSGGICAWNAAWERNDFFHLVYMNSPTFSAFRGGDSLTVLMRKYETKPIRAYMTAGTDDMRNSAGDWYLEALSANAAMKYAQYDFKFEVFEGGTHGFGWRDPLVFERAMRFVWNNFGEPVRPLGLPPRVADIVALDEPWRATDEAMPGYCVPTISNGTYSFDKGRIWLNQTDGVRKLAADNFGDISSIAISSDRWRLYVADKNKRFVYVMSIQLDGSLTECYAHGHLHLADDCITLGAAAICVDTEDRVYAATQLGIQTISWTGQNNTILALPGHLPVTGLAFGRVDRKVLYAESNVKVFKRKVNTSGLTETTPLITPESPSF